MMKARALLVAALAAVLLISCSTDDDGVRCPDASRCSEARDDQHELRVSVAETTGALTHSFDATEFANGCSRYDYVGAEGCFDLDGDGYGQGAACLGPDCDKADEAINPAADEVYYNGVDEDCDASTGDDDADGDGYDADARGGDDCDDADADINPAGTEVTGNSVDEDCSGEPNDVDGDGHDDVANGGTDCDDGRPNVNPDQTEVIGNGLDDDCDASTSDGYEHSTGLGKLFYNMTPSDTSSRQGAIDACNAHYNITTCSKSCGNHSCGSITRDGNCHCSPTSTIWNYGNSCYAATLGAGTVEAGGCSGSQVGSWY